MLSANSHTPNVVTNCRMIEVGMCCTRSISRMTSHPSARPAITLRATANKKVGASAPNEKPLPATAPTATR
jgi:hypothetical protein